MLDIAIILGRFIFGTLCFILFWGLCLICAGNTKTAFKRMSHRDSLDPKNNNHIKGKFSNVAMVVIIAVLCNVVGITYGLLFLDHGAEWIGIVLFCQLIFDDISTLYECFAKNSIGNYLEAKALKSKKHRDIVKCIAYVALCFVTEFLLDGAYLIGTLSI